MAADGANGLITALQLLGAQGRLDAADGGGSQAEMFEADAPLPVMPAKGVSGSKGGRPTGAVNRSTEDWVRYFLSQYRAPLTVLGAIYSKPTADLHAELQAMADRYARTRTLADGREIEEKVLISPLDVLKLQQATAVALGPYIHKQQPKAIEIEQRQRGIMVLGDLGVTEAVTEDSLALPLPPEAG